MTPCVWCDRGAELEPHNPLFADRMHVSENVYGEMYRTAHCERGPVERELRAYDWRKADPYRLSARALDLLFSAYESWRELGVPHASEDWLDIASEAIEAAAELGL